MQWSPNIPLDLLGNVWLCPGTSTFPFWGDGFSCFLLTFLLLFQLLLPYLLCELLTLPSKEGQALPWLPT